MEMFPHVQGAKKKKAADEYLERLRDAIRFAWHCEADRGKQWLLMFFISTFRNWNKESPDYDLAYISQKSVAKFLGVSAQRIGKLFKRLVDLGILERKRRGRGWAYRFLSEEERIRHKANAKAIGQSRGIARRTLSEQFLIFDESGLPVMPDCLAGGS